MGIGLYRNACRRAFVKILGAVELCPVIAACQRYCHGCRTIFLLVPTILARAVSFLLVMCGCVNGCFPFFCYTDASTYLYHGRIFVVVGVFRGLKSAMALPFAVGAGAHLVERGTF